MPPEIPLFKRPQKRFPWEKPNVQSMRQPREKVPKKALKKGIRGKKIFPPPGGYFEKGKKCPTRSPGGDLMGPERWELKNLKGKNPMWKKISPKREGEKGNLSQKGGMVIKGY